MKIRRVNRRIYSILLIVMIMAVSLLCAAAPAAFAADGQRRTVRVGVYDMDNFISRHDDTYSGYGIEYMGYIAKINGWDIEYVPGSLSECIARLEDGSVDIVPGVCAMPEDDEFSLVQPPIGYTGFRVCVSKDSGITEPKQLNGAVIGVFDVPEWREATERYTQESELSVTLKYYQSVGPLFDDYYSGKIDGIISTDYFADESSVFLARFGYAPIYAGVRKDDEIYSKTRGAIEQICVGSPEYSTYLRRKYCASYSIRAMQFTVDELEYISDTRVLRAVYQEDALPLSGTDDKTGDFTGTVREIADYIETETGMMFEFLPANGYDRGFEMLKNGEADIILSVSEGKGSDGDVDTTAGYLSLYYYVVSSGEYSETTAPVIAVTRDLMLLDTVKVRYPEAELYFCDTVEDCFDAVKNNKADILIINTYTAEKMLDNPKYASLKARVAEGMSTQLSVAVSPDADPRLYTVLSKTLSGLSGSTIDNIILSSTKSLDSRSFLEEFVYSDPYTVIGVVSAFFGIIIIVIIGMFIQRMQFSKKQIQMLYTDPITGFMSYQKFKIDAPVLIGKKDFIGYSITYLDFKNFKFINDMYGYSVGDSVIKNFAEVLASETGKTECFARINADKFVLLLEYVSREALLERLEHCKQKLLEFELLSKEKYSTIIYSGSYVLDADSRALGIVEMVDRAGIALKSIKNNTKGITSAFYEESLRENIYKTKNIENAMNEALNNGEFRLYIQPQHHILNSEAVLSCEALVRWEIGNSVVLPGEFIPVLERNGFIVDLDRYMLRKVCEFLRSFLNTHPDKVLKTAVNVSRLNLYRDDFVEVCCKTKDEYNIPDGLLELEFTESLAFDNKESFRAIVTKLKAHGFTCALDDFGAGSSSLNILKDLPIDVLKMDRLFFDEGESLERDNALITGVVAMAKSLGLTVVAEGIETQEQIDFLKAIGCDIIQGFIYSRPLPVEEFLRYISWFKGDTDKKYHR